MVDDGIGLIAVGDDVAGAVDSDGMVNDERQIRDDGFVEGPGQYIHPLEDR